MQVQSAGVNAIGVVMLVIYSVLGRCQVFLFTVFLIAVSAGRAGLAVLLELCGCAHLLGWIHARHG